MSVIRGDPSLQTQPILSSTDTSAPIIAPNITVTPTVASNDNLEDIFPNADLQQISSKWQNQMSPFSITRHFAWVLDFM